MNYSTPKLDRARLRVAYEDATRQRTSFWKPENGPNKIRPLPGWVSTEPIVPFVMIGQHYLGGEDKKPLICPATPGIVEGDPPRHRDCPLCKVAKNLMKSGTEVELELGKQLKVRTNYLWNIVVRGKEQEGVKVFSAGWHAHTALLGYVDDETNWPNFTDLMTGADIILEKTGSGMLTKYAVRVANPSCPLLRTIEDSYKLFEGAPDLTKFLKAESATFLMAALRKAQDLEENDPVDDGSTLGAAMARVASHIAPEKSQAERVMGLSMPVDVSASAAAPPMHVRDANTPPFDAEPAEIHVKADVPVSVGMASGDSIGIHRKETPEAETIVNVASVGASVTGGKASLADLKARLNARLNKG